MKNKLQNEIIKKQKNISNNNTQNISEGINHTNEFSRNNTST